MEELDYAKVLSRITFKPNFQAEVYPRTISEEYNERSWWFRGVMYVEDAYKAKPWTFEEIAERIQEIDFSYHDFGRKRFITPTYHMPHMREVIPVQGNYRIPPFGVGEDQMFIDWVRYTLREMEQHEFDEWFKVDGVMLNDPHAAGRL